MSDTQAPIPSLADRVRLVNADAPVVGVHFLGAMPVFVLGEESLLFAGDDQRRVEVHAGAILASASDDGTGEMRSYLATEENYRLLRDMERKNLIIPLVGDFAGPKTIRSVGQYVRDHDAVVSAFYLSNVEQYLFNEFKSADFYNNVGTLPLDAMSTFIRASRGGGFGGSGGGAFRFTSITSPSSL